MIAPAPRQVIDGSPPATCTAAPPWWSGPSPKAVTPPRASTGTCGHSGSQVASDRHRARHGDTTRRPIRCAQAWVRRPSPPLSAVHDDRRGGEGMATPQPQDYAVAGGDRRLFRGDHSPAACAVASAVTQPRGRVEPRPAVAEPTISVARSPLRGTGPMTAGGSSPANRVPCLDPPSIVSPYPLDPCSPLSPQPPSPSCERFGLVRARTRAGRVRREAVPGKDRGHDMERAAHPCPV